MVRWWCCSCSAVKVVYWWYGSGLLVVYRWCAGDGGIVLVWSSWCSDGLVLVVVK